MNATEITAEETMDQEVFSIEANEKNAVFRLAAGNITKAEVWVQEHREYSEEQLAKLRQAYEIRTEKTEDGTVRHVWIRWEERENFASSTETDCHYMLDKNEGILQFSDGIHGSERRAWWTDPGSVSEHESGCTSPGCDSACGASP